MEPEKEKEFTKEDLNRDWRNDNATSKQIDYLKSRGIDTKENLSKFEANIMIKGLRKETKKEELPDY